MPPFLGFCFLTFVLFLGLSVEPDMLLKLRNTLRYLLGAFQLPADRAQGKGDILDLGAYVLATSLAAVQLAPGKNKGVNIRLQGVRKHG